MLIGLENKNTKKSVSCLSWRATKRDKHLWARNSPNFLTTEMEQNYLTATIFDCRKEVMIVFDNGIEDIRNAHFGNGFWRNLEYEIAVQIKEHHNCPVLCINECWACTQYDSVAKSTMSGRDRRIMHTWQVPTLNPSVLRTNWDSRYRGEGFFVWATTNNSGEAS